MCSFYGIVGDDVLLPLNNRQEKDTAIYPLFSLILKTNSALNTFVAASRYYLGIFHLSQNHLFDFNLFLKFPSLFVIISKRDCRSVTSKNACGTWCYLKYNTDVNLFGHISQPKALVFQNFILSAKPGFTFLFHSFVIKYSSLPLWSLKVIIFKNIFKFK